MLDKRPIRGPWAVTKNSDIGRCRQKSAPRNLLCETKSFVLRVVLRTMYERSAGCELG